MRSVLFEFFFSFNTRLCHNAQIKFVERLIDLKGFMPYRKYFKHITAGEKVCSIYDYIKL